MIRPIETNMSLYAVDQKAHRAQSDPNTHTNLAMQQAEAIKKANEQLNTVQKSPETEGEVKIRDRDSEKNKRDQGKRRRRGDGDEAENGAGVEAKDAGSKEHFDFLA